MCGAQPSTPGRGAYVKEVIDIEARRMDEQAQSLTERFKEGAAARRAGLQPTDNPYPMGSDERREWDAGFHATFDLDEEDDPASNRLHEKYD